MTMPQAVEQALRRSQTYAVLSRGFLYPSPGVVDAMMAAPAPLESLGLRVPAGGLEEEYLNLFGGQVPACPPYETEYTASHVWMQTQQMADVAGFYRAFGVDTQETGERVDSLTAELEFMYVLCIKEAIAENDSDPDGVGVCREAQGKFLREHLAVWLPRFVARLEQAGAEGYYPALARVTERYVSEDASRFPGEGA
ncbi:MAG TPA: molecular chaperone TorD family protein [Symbiobacteriaceae bacterium]|nr:molecular chaperone TorD family protein [Symbiobacteriaceae bacterium]